MLDIQDAWRSLEGQPVLRGIHLQIAPGEILCLLGPSGSGKTTLLRVVAGLERLDSGDVRYEGESIVSIPVHQRDFGLMFQDFALFPHMDVAANVGFGLKMHHATDPDARVREVIDLVGLAGFESRDVGQLSGGEKQRVALARSLAPRPRFLMLDEPLGSLDAALRARLVVELRQIIKRTGLTALYVTHDQHEAFAVADRIAIMSAGIIEQVDTPQAIYSRPATTFVAEFLGLSNVIHVDHYEDRRAHTALGMFPVTQSSEAILLHPLGLRLVGEGEASVEARVKECVFQGDTYQVKVLHPSGVLLTLRVPADSERLPLEGAVVHIGVQADRIVPLRPSAATP